MEESFHTNETGWWIYGIDLAVLDRNEYETCFIDAECVPEGS